MHKLGEVRVFCHFYSQAVIDNPRSYECNVIVEPRWELLRPDVLKISEPDVDVDPEKTSKLLSYGDVYQDSGLSLRNLMHQLYSLKIVWAAAQEWAPDAVIFARPDLRYHDSAYSCVKRALQFLRPAVYTPRWQQWLGGSNDRFAICIGKKAAESFASRLDLASDYCNSENCEGGLHAERLLLYSLLRSGCYNFSTNLTASRVRANGQTVVEDFADMSSLGDKARIFCHNTCILASEMISLCPKVVGRKVFGGKKSVNA